MYSIRNLMLATSFTLTACQQSMEPTNENITDTIGKTTKVLA